MAGHEFGVALQIDAGFRLQHAHDGKRHGHQCRLGVLGERKLVGGALPHDRGEGLGQRRIDFLEYGARGCKRLGQRFAHTDRLAALPREYERGRHPCNLA
jgi:hypothetical protein